MLVVPPFVSQSTTAKFMQTPYRSHKLCPLRIREAFLKQYSPNSFLIFLTCRRASSRIESTEKDSESAGGRRWITKWVEQECNCGGGDWTLTFSFGSSSVVGHSEWVYSVLLYSYVRKYSGRTLIEEQPTTRESILSRPHRRLLNSHYLPSTSSHLISSHRIPGERGEFRQLLEDDESKMVSYWTGRQR